MIISNSNYHLVHCLDCITKMKKTLQFYKAKASKSSIREQNILAASRENIILYKAASRFAGKGVIRLLVGCCNKNPPAPLPPNFLLIFPA